MTNNNTGWTTSVGYAGGQLGTPGPPAYLGADDGEGATPVAGAAPGSNETPPSVDGPSRFTVGYGQRLRAARRAAGLTQGELAEVIGLARASVANIEAGRQRTLAEDVITAAEACRVDPRWLLTGWNYGPAPDLEPMAPARLLKAHVLTLRKLADRLEEATST